MTEITINGKTFSMDGYLQSNLDQLKKAVSKDWDGVFLIDGMEGSGKSSLGVTCLYYLTNGNFTVDNVVYTPEQFERKVEESKVGEAILWDEFVLGGMSEDTLTKMQRSLIKKFTMMREKRLYVCLIIPYIFLLKPYFAVARTRFLLQTYSNDGIDRGSFKFYNYPAKSYIYFTGKKKWFYPKEAKPSFIGNFGNYLDRLIDKEKYTEKKRNAYSSMDDKEETYRFKLAKAIYFIYKNNKVTYKQIGEVFGYGERGVGHMIEDIEKKTDQDELYKLLDLATSVENSK